MKCVVALLLCMTMVFGTNLSTLADGNVVLSEQQEQQAEPKNDQTTVTGDEKTEAPAAENPDGQTEKKQEDAKTEDNTDASAQTPETPEVPETSVKPETPQTPETETPAKPETSKDSQEQQAEEDKRQAGQEVQEEKKKENIDTMEEKNYPEYLTGIESGVESHKSHEATDNDFRWDEESQSWKCRWYDDDKYGQATYYGPRDKHYVRIKYDGSGESISYIRCDVYGGEETDGTYYPVYYMNEDMSSMLHSPLFESVRDGDEAKETSDTTDGKLNKGKSLEESMQDGYWTLGKFKPGYSNTDEIKINTEEDLQKYIQDSKEKVDLKNYDEKVKSRLFFIWHPQTTLEESVEGSKSVELINWDERLYKLTLTANSTSKQNMPGVMDKANMVLALDVSAQMGGKVEDQSLCLKDEVTWDGLGKPEKESPYYFLEDGLVYKIWYEKGFLGIGGGYKYSSATGEYEREFEQSEHLNAKFYKTYQALTKFDIAKEAAKNVVSELAELSPQSMIQIIGFDNQVRYESKKITALNTEEINKFIDGIAVSDESSVSFSSALNKAQSSLKDQKNPNIAIFSTGEQGSRDDQNTAEKVKDSGIVIETVKIDTKTSGYLEKIASEEKNYASDETANLVAELGLKYIEDGASYLPVEGATIIDYIDKRFEIIEPMGTPLASRTAIFAVGETYLPGMIGTDEQGRQYIKWDDVQIDPKHEDGTAGWTAEVYIKAKDDYIGGNNIPTNGDGSGIKLKGSKENAVTFGKPCVNVKVNFEIKNKSANIFYGETIPVTGVEEYMCNISQYLKSDYGVEQNDFKFKWYTDEALNDPTTLEVMENIKPEPEEVRNFYLQVLYNAGNPTKESNKNSKQQEQYVSAMSKGEEVEGGTPLPYGRYEIKVTSGSIQIKKKVSGMDDKDKATFTFKIKNTDTNQTWYRAITVDTGKLNDKKVVKAELLSGLPKGKYEVTELDTLKYHNDGKEIIDKTTCPTDNLKNIYMGWESENNSTTNINKNSATIQFTNTKKNNKELSDSDVRLNRFTKSGKKWSCDKITVPQEPENSKEE